jgi:hypothetical protein
VFTSGLRVYSSVLCGQHASHTVSHHVLRQARIPQLQGSGGLVGAGAEMMYVGWSPGQFAHAHREAAHNHCCLRTGQLYVSL